MEYPMKHYTYLWEYSQPNQELPVSNYFSALAAMFKSCQPKLYHFVLNININNSD